MAAWKEQENEADAAELRYRWSYLNVDNPP